LERKRLGSDDDGAPATPHLAIYSKSCVRERCCQLLEMLKMTKERNSAAHHAAPLEDHLESDGKIDWQNI